jgi:muramoyltetrapeptide carboxypeptidase
MTIGIISPASAVKDVSRVDTGASRLRELGYKVKEGRHVREKLGFLAATDDARLADLHAMFADPKVDAIMCVRGGYGAGRLASRIDYKLVQHNPKILLGFSDITFLHLAFWNKCGLVTFNGPMLNATFAQEQPSVFTISGFNRTLTRYDPAGSIWQGHPDRKFRVVRHGRAGGRLVGGNLSLVAASLGTPFEINTRGKLVFLEEIDEKPYRIDRMLTQLLHAGKLCGAAAIVFGRNVPDEETAALEKAREEEGLPKIAAPLPRKVPREWEPITDDVIADRLKPLGIPVMIGLPYGHIDDYATIPIGVRATMDTRTGDLVIDESAVV